VLKIVENVRAVRAPPNPAGELTALLKLLSLWGWGLLPLPKNLTPMSAFGLDLRPFGPHSVVSPAVFISLNA